MVKLSNIKEKKNIFYGSQKLGLNYVLDYESERFLAPAYNIAGKSTEYKCYGGWESRQIQGHMLGHYLSSLSAFVKTECEGWEKAKEKLDYTVSRIKELQREDGYFACIPSTPFDTVFSGNFKVERFSLGDWWVPWYSVHKVFAGLIDAFTSGKNPDALLIVKRMADWVIEGTKKLSDQLMQKMMHCEHGGMCKFFADLYEITGEDKYLKEAERWIHKEIMTPAMNETDALQGFHANTQIPKFIGIAKLYDLTKKSEYRKAAEFFFRTVSEKRSYAIGGNSIGEHFGPQYNEKLGKDTCETCNSYNMLELSEYIFKWNRNPQTSDFVERVLYNHILASQDPESGAKTYFVSMESNTFKVYCSKENSMWCCTGTGIENPARYNRYIFFEDEKNIYINNYISSEIRTSDEWKIKIESDFPYSKKAKIIISEKGSSEKNIMLRIPFWSSESSDGKTKYISMDNDETEINLSSKLLVRKTLDASSNFNIFYGPIVLAADLGKSIPQDIVEDHLVYMQEKSEYEQDILTGSLENPDEWIRCTDEERLIFETEKSVSKKNISYRLQPFFATHHCRYAAYFPSSEATENERTKKLNDITEDFIDCGKQQSEVEHAYKNSGSISEYIKEIDNSCRYAAEENSFWSYRTKLWKNREYKIILSVYGNCSGKIEFSLMDGNESILKKIIDSSQLEKNNNSISDVTITLPKEFINQHIAEGDYKFFDIMLSKCKDCDSLKVIELRTAIG